ncbi:MAG: hypothetical protein M3O22_01565 [Pseudomonadota bacterium]|nr:hypothetical protein [Pseudomonadota bacterium]
MSETAAQTAYPVLGQALAIFRNSRPGPQAKALLLLNCLGTILRHVDGDRDTYSDESLAPVPSRIFRHMHLVFAEAFRKDPFADPLEIPLALAFRTFCQTRLASEAQLAMADAVLELSGQASDPWQQELAGVFLNGVLDNTIERDDKDMALRALGLYRDLAQVYRKKYGTMNRTGSAWALSGHSGLSQYLWEHIQGNPEDIGSELEELMEKYRGDEHAAEISQQYQEEYSHVIAAPILVKLFQKSRDDFGLDRASAVISEHVVQQVVMDTTTRILGNMDVPAGISAEEFLKALPLPDTSGQAPAAGPSAQP